MNTSIAANGSPTASSPVLRWLLGTTSTYAFETQSSLKINKLGMDNLIRSVFEVRVLDKNPGAGGYVVRVRTLRTEQSQQQGFHQLLAALNRVGEELEIEVNAMGYAQRILNRAALQAKWPGVRAALRHQFRALPQTGDLLAGLDQQLVTPGALEAAVLPNGFYGVLFGGWLGQSFASQPAERPPESRVLPRFFGTLDLPLRVRKYAMPPPYITQSHVHLAADGKLDDERFDADSWRRLLRQITDTPTLDPTITLTSRDMCTLAVLDGVLETATQHLRVEVPQVYRNEIMHRLTLQRPPL